jgi:hypothetical protein
MIGHIVVGQATVGTSTPSPFTNWGEPILGLKSASKIIKLADDPELTITKYLDPKYLATDSSNSLTFAPIVKFCDSKTW